MSAALGPWPLRRVWLVAWLVWSGLCAFWLAQTLVSRALGGHRVALSVVALSVESMWLWAALTPIILALCLRLPLGGEGRMRSLGWHALAALALAAADVAIDTPFVAVFAPGELAIAPRFVEEAFINLFSYAATADIHRTVTHESLETILSGCPSTSSG